MIANLFVGQSEGSVTWPADTRRREETEIYGTGCANTVELPCIRFGENFSPRTPVPLPPFFLAPSLYSEFLSGSAKSSITSKRYGLCYRDEKSRCFIEGESRVISEQLTSHMFSFFSFHFFTFYTQCRKY